MKYVRQHQAMYPQKGFLPRDLESAHFWTSASGHEVGYILFIHPTKYRNAYSAVLRHKTNQLDQ